MDMNAKIVNPVSSPSAAEATKAVPGGKDATPDNRSPQIKKDVQELLRQALDVEPVSDRKLEISFEDELNLFVVKVLDRESGEVIRQIPLPEQISIAKGLRATIRRMANDQSGFAVDQEV